jgi:hypothetical protein
VHRSITVVGCDGGYHVEARRRDVNSKAAALKSAAAVFVVGAGAFAALAHATVSKQGATVYPNSIVVIGHSGATGYDSDRLRSRWSHNSWATGDNPAVQSLYRRILAHNPQILGHNFNLAINGSNVASLLLQARKAVTLKPTPELVVIQSIDNDIACDGSDPKRYQPFGEAVVRVLGVLAEGAPDARVFVVSQFGSPGTYLKALTPKQRKRIGGGSGPCDFVDASGGVIAKRLAYLESVIHGYEAALATACKGAAGCRFDRGAFGRVVGRPEYLSNDLNHLSVQGHAKAAAVAWSALVSVGIVPHN